MKALTTRTPRGDPGHQGLAIIDHLLNHPHQSHQLRNRPRPHLPCPGYPSTLHSPLPAIGAITHRTTMTRPSHTSLLPIPGGSPPFASPIIHDRPVEHLLSSQQPPRAPRIRSLIITIFIPFTFTFRLHHHCKQGCKPSPSSPSFHVLDLTVV